MKVSKDLTLDRFNAGSIGLAPLNKSAQMTLKGTFVYGTLVKDVA